jgi:beta-mannosidase
MVYQRQSLQDGWRFRQLDDTQSTLRDVAQFPTVIHLDLLHHGLIPEPSQDRNSELIQWVGEAHWLYTTTFDVKGDPTDYAKHILVFEGLDTYAHINLNGQRIADAANMFLEYRVDVGHLLKSKDNKLEIVFDPAILVGRALEKKQGFKNLFWNGDSSRMNVRKIGCHFGWDW